VNARRRAQQDSDMTEKTPPAAVDRVTITTLIDNYTDLLLPSTEAVQRAARTDKQGKTKEPLLASHGLSLLVETWRAGEHRGVLADAGAPWAGVGYNWRILDLDPRVVEAIFLSHGHWDHFSALRDFLLFRGGKVPLVLHPDAFLHRTQVFADGRRMDHPWIGERQALEEAGAQIMVTTEPYEIVPGLMTTGQVQREVPFEGPNQGRQAAGKGPTRLIDKAGQWQTDEILDDQALFLRVQGKGLVVIAGCAHAGIINTIRQAQRLSGEERVYAVVGGFHLTDASPEKIQATVEALRDLAPAVSLPTHCTGFAATAAIARALPNAFVLNSVGTRLIL
jgi:7,8-dihydropterin-6-yl-methyl-4-(beta-D-ribofuranosyl)aminobenzene 5'-phosphate synthase